MAAYDVLTSPLVIFGIAIAVSYLLYAWSRTIAPRVPDTVNKTMPYVGGEPIEFQSFQPGYQFYYVALFFTVVHVAALVIATAPSSASLLITLGYLVIIAIAVVVLRWEQ